MGGGRPTLGVWKKSSLIDKTDSLVCIFQSFKYKLISTPSLDNYCSFRISTSIIIIISKK